uniref:RXYLT1 C-terminal domain-containing protein n=1 Tax=Compsopogon caeruleus TaxID=31354 RepID=A0A7S1XBJ5_9RHOD|mmetsp:Transcript_13091/g.26564  ORF Transcript_13091/g.26564 Transcript_13091/m.26564 type:complete len:400 (+) Transcript_13091:278-1477(+)
MRRVQWVEAVGFVVSVLVVLAYLVGRRSADEQKRRFVSQSSQSHGFNAQALVRFTFLINTDIASMTLFSFFKNDIIRRYGTGTVVMDKVSEASFRHEKVAGNLKALLNPSLPCIAGLRWERLVELVEDRANWSAPSCRLFVVGDEFCAEDAEKVAEWATFWQFPSSSRLRNPAFRKIDNLPLTVRFDIWEAFQEFRGGSREAAENFLPTPSSKRSLLFNAIFTVEMSGSRQECVEVLNGLNSSLLSQTSSFVHISNAWAKEDRLDSPGFVNAANYTNILHNSVFTLSPVGHHPECFRMYEAMDAGSIPIIALDETYQKKDCKDGLYPMIQEGAPFPFLRTWDELPSFLEKWVKARPSEIDELQKRITDWYEKYMRARTLEFETRLIAEFGSLENTGSHH